MEKELRENYNLLHAVVEGMTDAIYAKDIQGRYLMINSAGATLIGRTADEVIGKDDTALFAPDIAHQIMEDDRKIIYSGETETYEEELLATTGIKRTYLTTKGVYRDLQGKVIGIIGVSRDITERKQAEEMVQHLAYYDILTDLPNRVLFHDNIDRAITAAKNKNRPFALFAINLDRFRDINNTLGYNNGDLLLQQTGKRLKETIREDDTIARLGGDGFAVLLQNADAEVATESADKIIKRFEEPFMLTEISIDISVSVGIALFPGHGEDAGTLIRRAHIAMHAAKKVESGFCLYSSRYDQFIPERLALMGELRHAIESNQLFLLYQPKIDLKTGKPIGLEALVRWQHPKLGIIPPGQFIELAEHTGIIKDLTFWVIKEALRQSRSWHQAGMEISVAVNLSVRNLQAPQLLDQIKGLLSTWGVTPSKLRFEITESIIMTDPERAMDVITQLTVMGMRFSIDDFGTGYSSLGYLQRLPVDEIKIDKSFVMNMMVDENSMKIVCSIIELGHSMGLKITAEGVENKETLDKLTSLGCDAAQGYLISKPIPQAEITSWLIGQTGRI